MVSIKEIKQKVDNATINMSKKIHNDSSWFKPEENAFWIIFDKRNTPYFAHLTHEAKNDEYSLNLFEIDDTSRISENKCIGYCVFLATKISAYIDTIIISNRHRLNLGLGSKIYDISEYICQKRGMKIITGELFAFSNYKTDSELRVFYKHKHFDIDDSKVFLGDGYPRLFKAFEEENISNFEKSLKFVKKDGILFNVIMPKNLEKEKSKEREI